MPDPITLAKTIESASKVANTPFFTTIIDKVTGFRLSKWAAEGEVRKKLIHDEYEKAKEAGIMGMQYIEYMRSTENLIKTAVKSTKYINHTKPNDIKIDNDFFWNTIEHVKNVSNNDMQELIAKIIAGEYNSPGAYSIGTLQILKMLGEKELDLFEKICSLCIHDGQIPSNVFHNYVFPNNDLDSYNIHYGILLELQNLGLILSNEMSMRLNNNEGSNFTIKYYDESLVFEHILGTKNEIISPSYYGLSTSGKQIIQHLNPIPSESFYIWLRKNYKIPNYRLTKV